MKKRIPIILGLFLTGFAIWMLLAPTKFTELIVSQLQQVGYDVQLRTALLTKKVEKPNKIVIVDIDDKSLKAEGRWPWPRSLMGKLVDKLNDSGAIVIAFDVFFSEHEKNLSDIVTERLKKIDKLPIPVAETLLKERSVFDEDTIFAKSLESSDAVLAISFLNEKTIQNILPKPTLTLNPKQQRELKIYQGQGYISSVPILMKAGIYGGFINIIPDDDGVVRRAPLIYRYKNDIYASLALQAMLTYLGGDISLVSPVYDQKMVLEGINFNSQFIPTNARGEMLIPFIGPSYSFNYYSATDVLQGKLPEDALLGKIIFIGTSATGLGDLQATAIQNPFPGVEIQASVANGILTGKFSYRPAWTLGANLFLTAIFGLLASFLFPYFGARTHIFFIVTLPIGLLVFNNWFWLKTGLVISFLIPVVLVILVAIMNILYSYLFESRKREQIKSIFGQYVPEKHIDQMLQAGGEYGMKGEDRQMSVLFADIRNFTSISEKMSATDLVEMLNTYFTPMTKIIFDNKGTIDKYVGDLIMAFWGAPLKDKKHTYHALKSALEMQAKAAEMEKELMDRGWSQLRIGIGVNSGEMSVGDMGSQYRRNYTVLGDSVNLGSRVESITKFYGVDIAVTEYSQKNQDAFVFRKLDKVKVKGKKTGVEIYELICKKKDLTDKLTEDLKQYNLALGMYYQKAWSQSKAILTKLATENPDVKIYQLYLDRIAEFEKTPPPDDWKGVFVHTSK